MVTCMPPILSIVSKKGSGKTTLIEKLIPELKSRGYRVGTIKHDTHGFEIDREGKDTWRHKQAGAHTVAISSPWKISVIKDVDWEMDLDRIVESYFSDLDVVITEGYKWARKAQVEVFRGASHERPLYTKEEPHPLMAVMSDIDIDLGVPRFHIDDVQGLADFVESNLLKN
jgi:molybdopterin-guanine dinucleotide biosynthesis protein B